MSTTDKKQPEARVRVGTVTGAIWANEGEGGKTFLNATFQRSYKDKDGKWGNSDSYGVHALLELAKCADATHTRLLKMYGDMPKDKAPETPDEEIPF